MNGTEDNMERCCATKSVGRHSCRPGFGLTLMFGRGRIFTAVLRTAALSAAGALWPMTAMAQCPTHIAPAVISNIRDAGIRAAAAQLVIDEAYLLQHGGANALIEGAREEIRALDAGIAQAAVSADGLSVSSGQSVVSNPRDMLGSVTSSASSMRDAREALRGTVHVLECWARNRSSASPPAGKASRGNQKTGLPDIHATATSLTRALFGEAQGDEAPSEDLGTAVEARSTMMGSDTFKPVMSAAAAPSDDALVDVLMSVDKPKELHVQYVIRGSPLHGYYKRVDGIVKATQGLATLALSVEDVDRNWLTTDECVVIDVEMLLTLASSTGSSSNPKDGSLSGHAQAPGLVVQRKLSLIATSGRDTQTYEWPIEALADASITVAHARSCSPEAAKKDSAEVRNCSDSERLALLDRSAALLVKIGQSYAQIDVLERAVADMRREVGGASGTVGGLLAALNLWGAGARAMLEIQGIKLPALGAALGRAKDTADVVAAVASLDADIWDALTAGGHAAELLEPGALSRALTMASAFNEVRGAVEDVAEWQRLRNTVEDVTVVLGKNVASYRARLSDARVKLNKMQQLLNNCGPVR